MAGVFTGFGVIGILIAVGYALGRTNLLGEGARPAFARLLFWVAQPALLFTLIVQNDLASMFSGVLTAQVVSLVAAIIAYVAIVVPIWRPSPGETVIGAMSASYVNIGNLGIPIAVYALGDQSSIAPIMLFQMAVYTPLLMIALDLSTGAGEGAVAALRHVLHNPVLITSVVAILLSAFHVTLPSVIFDPISMIAGLSVPLMLFNFGMSLAARPPFTGDSPTGRITVAVIVKGVLQPAVAWVVADRLLGMSGHLLLVSVVMAALPTAQNTLTYATNYNVGKVLARDTAFTSTLLAVPIIAVIVWLLY